MKPWTKPSFGNDETVTTAWKDDAEGLIVVNTFQDVEDIIENNKRLQTMPQKSDWGRHVACIPNNIINLWLAEEWNRGNTTIKAFGKEFNELVDRKLKDPDWAYLRTDK